MIKPLGKILVECGFITNLQLSEALLRQKSSGGARRMGDILIEMGILPQEKLDIALQRQQETATRSNRPRAGVSGRISGFSQSRTPQAPQHSHSAPQQPFPSSPQPVPPTGYQPASLPPGQSGSQASGSKGHLALVQLLIKKGIISMEEYFNEIQGK